MAYNVPIVGSFAGTPPTLVQSGASTDGADGLTLPAAPVAGNLLVAASMNPLVPTPGAGWTLVYNQGTGLDYGLIFMKVAGGAEPALQTPLSVAPATGALIIWELSGQHATTPIIAYNGIPETSSASMAGPPMPGVVNCIALHGAGVTANITGAYNMTTDHLLNTGTRHAYGGHSFAPTMAQALMTGDVANWYKIVTCLVLGA